MRLRASAAVYCATTWPRGRQSRGQFVSERSKCRRQIESIRSVSACVRVCWSSSELKPLLASPLHFLPASQGNVGNGTRRKPPADRQQKGSLALAPTFSAPKLIRQNDYLLMVQLTQTDKVLHLRLKFIVLKPPRGIVCAPHDH